MRLILYRWRVYSGRAATSAVCSPMDSPALRTLAADITARLGTTPG